MTVSGVMNDLFEDRERFRAEIADQIRTKVQEKKARKKVRDCEKLLTKLGEKVLDSALQECPSQKQKDYSEGKATGLLGEDNKVKGPPLGGGLTRTQ